MQIGKFLSENKAGVAIALIVLLIGALAYFQTAGPDPCFGSEMCQGKRLSPLLVNSKFKVAYGPNNSLKLFAHAPYGLMGQLYASEGIVYPSADGMVIGSMEAAMMKKEKLMSGAGSRLENLFGMNISVGGILKKTMTQADAIHFLDENQFSKNNGEEGRAFIKPLPNGLPKLFMRLNLSEAKSFPYALSEGNMSDYSPRDINGEKFYPMLVGSDEAKMMRSERLFSKVGDTLPGFFGHNMFIAGIVNKTSSGVDMAHFLQFSQDEVGFAQ